MIHPQITSYVAGFMFNLGGTVVVMIEKQKPEWQKGSLNGVGGKIEKGETPVQAMIREFEEETGVRETNWDRFATLKGPGWEVYFFKTFSGLSDNVKTTTGEEIFRVPVNLLPSFKQIQNIPWLVKLALDPDNPKAAIHYK